MSGLALIKTMKKVIRILLNYLNNHSRRTKKKERKHRDNLKSTYLCSIRSNVKFFLQIY